MTVFAVAIGRNEGERLRDCFDSMAHQVDRIVYVDSGSTDNSREIAREAGAEIVHLDASRPFTAARARNAGFEHIKTTARETDFIQFIDGDCALRDGWIAQAQAFLRTHPDVGVVCGRRRERFPEASVYNRLIDREWDTPAGESKACGGDALVRVAAFITAGGFNPGMIAGEEPELCVRLRQAGWRIWRLDAEMTWHDAALKRFGAWWQRARRAGHAYAEGATLHGAAPERHNVTQTRRALLWGLGPGVVVVLALVVTPWALVGLLAWPLQIIRLALKSADVTEAAFLTLSKIPEALGVLTYYWRQFKGADAQLMEYK
jgi:GT2 family glycosyltransferase